MSVMITETKKISELELLLEFTDDATVLISDNGKTAQMTLAKLIAMVVEKVEPKISLHGKVLANTAAISKLTSDQSALAEKVTSFELSVSGKVNACDEDIAVLTELVDGACYTKETITSYSQMYATNAVPPTSINGNVGDLISAESLYEAGTGDIYMHQVQAGDILTYTDDSVFNATNGYIYVLNGMGGGYIVEIIDTDDLLEAHSHTFAQDGYVFVPLKHYDDGRDLLIFRRAFDASLIESLPEVGTANNTQILQVVNGKWSIGAAPASQQQVADLNVAIGVIEDVLKNEGIL